MIAAMLASQVEKVAPCRVDGAASPGLIEGAGHIAVIAIDWSFGHLEVDVALRDPGA